MNYYYHFFRSTTLKRSPTPSADHGSSFIWMVLWKQLTAPAWHPYLGASPDGLIKCECHGLGTLEIKCPFCLNSQSLDEAAESSSFCLQNDSEGFKLKETHAYYYQVQLQMHVTKSSYCDFVVWQKGQLLIQRIPINENFQSDSMCKAKDFFVGCILPELLCKYFSRIRIQSNSVAPSCDLPCYCKNQIEGSVIIVCGDENCATGQFHLSCLGLKRKPRKGWMCPDCRTKAKAAKKAIKN